jgi:hypothetical protein
MAIENRAPTGAADRLRDDIDRGRTGDKVDWPDPAAAPLGTDDEAGGNTSPSGTVEGAREREVASAANAAQRRQGVGAAWILIAVIVVAAIVALAFAVT